MLELHLDPVGGIAGDMFVAAILDLRPELEVPLKAALQQCPLIEDVEVALMPHNDGVLTGKRFTVRRRGEPDHHHGPAHDEHPHDHDHHHHTRPHQDEHIGHHEHGHAHTDWKLIREALASSSLDPDTIRHAIGIFSLLAEAEARVHGMPVEKVSFHEVGAWDSITDIVSAGWLIAQLGAQRWTSGALPLGSGRVRTAHGALPVPAPATALLLEGFDMIDDGVGGERVTPTGAAILRYLCDREGLASPPRRLKGSAHGFGTRRLGGISNCLRVLAFDVGHNGHTEQDRVALLECEIDDQTGEDLAQAIDNLRSEPGVLDIVQAPVYGKKGRLMTGLRILARPEAIDDVLALVFDETTTIGIRHSIVSRSRLARTEMTVASVQGPLRAKQVRRPSGVTTKIEADETRGIKGARERMKIRHLADRVDSCSED